MAASMAMRYVIPAVTSLGARVLADAEASASSAIVDMGRRLLRTMLRGGADAPAAEASTPLAEAVKRRVLKLANDPREPRAAIQLEASIEDLLLADAELRKSVQLLLERAPRIDERGGARSVSVGRDNSGLIITGDHNSLVQRRRT
jgi:hypothetical protein